MNFLQNIGLYHLSVIVEKQEDILNKWLIISLFFQLILDI